MSRRTLVLILLMSLVIVLFGATTAPASRPRVTGGFMVVSGETPDPECGVLLEGLGVVSIWFALARRRSGPSLVNRPQTTV